MVAANDGKKNLKHKEEICKHYWPLMSPRNLRDLYKSCLEDFFTQFSGKMSPKCVLKTFIQDPWALCRSRTEHFEF